MTDSSPWTTRSASDLRELAAELTTEFANLKQQQLSLDLTRGKPASEQLNLANQLDGILAGDYHSSDGTDTRNYGGIRGIVEARELGAELLGVPADEVLAAGNSSLQLMHQATSWAQQQRWDGTEPTMLCPVPGYDRHFTVCEDHKLPMVTVTMDDSGPDINELRRLVTEPHVGGIWCVPRFRILLAVPIPRR